MTSRRDERRALEDRKRRKALPWRKWYATKAWKLKRAAQLAKTPWCEPCRRQGRSRPATVANHKVRHRGDRDLFFHGETESACKECHDAAIQREEIEGFSREIDDDGWPADPRHPFNRGAG